MLLHFCEAEEGNNVVKYRKLNCIHTLVNGLVKLHTLGYLDREEDQSDQKVCRSISNQDTELQAVSSVCEFDEPDEQVAACRCRPCHQYVNVAVIG